jgi:hypothetical protein
MGGIMADNIKGTYRDVEVARIVITNHPLPYGPRTINRWVWTRYDDNGTQIDGTGAVHNAELDGDRDDLEKELKKRFPKDVIE